ncbi:MAG: formylglycine-generating enzyme family protein [Akkermansiaceae bacterium]
MIRFVRKFQTSHIFPVIIALLCAGAVAQAETAPDIKPALAKDGFDEEEMRLAKAIHKRILDYQGIKKKTNNGKEEELIAFQDPLASGAKIDMLPVKGGEFTWRGEEKDDILKVSLSPFWMSKHEITWEAYEPFMLSPIPRQKDGQPLDFMRAQIKNDIEFIARPTPPYHPMTFGMKRDGHPALSMTQHAANKYCQWVSFQTGHFYRLPTEAEWEFACRAGSNTNSSWGTDAQKAGEYAWFGGDASTHYNVPGQKKPNSLGFHDMHGNVLEWTLDQYVPNRREYFAKGEVHNPWVKATKPYPHVTKGGHWQQSLQEISAAARHQSTPIWKVADPQRPRSLWYHTTTPWLGLRIVRPAKIPTVEEMYHYWNSGVEADE